jgi:hypothetical protein
VNLSITLGKSSINNKDIVLDLGKDNIHTVVFSGMTGSGKSAFHHRVIQQLMRQNSPEEVGFVLIDFKKVEFGEYNGSPYLLQPVLFEIEEAAVSLRGLVRESSRRSQGKIAFPTTLVVHIEECDIVYHAPGLLEELWKAVDEQSSKNNMHLFFSSSRTSPEVFSRELLQHTDVKGWFVPGGDWYRGYDDKMNAYASQILDYPPDHFPKPWTRIFQLRNGVEIECL